MMDRVSIMSFNVNRIRDKVKRLAIFNFVKVQKVSMLLLQETHCGADNESKVWERDFEGFKGGVWTHYSSSRAGVAILFNKDIPYQFQVKKCDND